MTKFFIKNKHKVASILSGKSRLHNKIFLGLNLLFGIFLSARLSIKNDTLAIGVFVVITVLSVGLFITIVNFEKKVWTGEFTNEYKKVINKVYDNINQYIVHNIDDGSLIADPIFILDTEISQEQFANKIKDPKTSNISYSKIMNYLNSTSTRWLINSNQANNIHCVSPFRMTAICFFEHNVIFISQVSSLPTCDIGDLRVIEEKYYQLSYSISGNKVVIGKFGSIPINQDVIAKLATITNVLTPYMI